MRRGCALAVVAVLMSIMLSGCDLWFSGSYSSVTPHLNDSSQIGQEVIEVSDYTQIRNALEELVESGADSGVFSVPSSTAATAEFYMQTAVDYVLENNPVGAYAVEKITFEIGTNRGESVVAFQMDYRYDRAQILRIRQASNMEEATEVIAGALKDCADSVTVLIHQYVNTDFAQLVQDYANDHPDVVMETPRTTVSVYPEKGMDRIVELNFTYRTDRDDLQEMQNVVQTVFTSAELYVKEAQQVKSIYAQLYSFLKQRHTYVLETSITPAYSLLQHGVGDSRAFANTYAAMCRRADLDCLVVSGTKNGNAHSWNMVRYRGRYYHVDLLAEQFAMLQDADMIGYVWDYSAYASG